MTYTFEWLVPEKILKVTLPPTFDDPIAQQFDIDVMPYLDGVSQPIHFIMDMRPVTVHPSIKTLTSLKHVQHRHLDHVVTIGLMSNPITRFMSSIVMRVVGTTMKDVSSEAEALAYLAAVDKKA